MVDGERAVEVRELINLLMELRGDMVALESGSSASLQQLHPNYRESGRNLLHYLALRQHDLRDLQARLATLGLSSLGRAESHALSTIESVLATLGALIGEAPAPLQAPPLSYAAGGQLLAQHTAELLQQAPAHRAVRIMVTMPTQAATDYQFVHDLVERGMDCMRVNCAHDGPEQWARMVANLERARKALDKPCLVEMDLGGPKLRTGPLQPGPSVLRIRPRRDPYGNVIIPARIWLTPATAPRDPPGQADAILPVDDAWLVQLEEGRRIHFVDARNSRRSWDVLDISPHGAWAEAHKTAYLVPATRLSRDKGGLNATELGELPSLEQPLLLRSGDQLLLTRDQQPGQPAVFDEQGEVLQPAQIGCTLPEVFDQVTAGDPVMFDDGRIAAEAEQVEADRVLVRIIRTAPGGARLRADKGINLPASALALSALTAKDLQDLEFAVEHADIIGLSFANRAEDVELLLEHIERLGPKRPAIVLKIETRRGFDNLPSILLAAMRAPRCGIMIARGDLAVECGFVRLAEAQEEILWLCEAAHIPVIWATQVLETLAKQGMPSRAEITDAAMGDRAECVMLNKGPHILAAVEVLDDILSRMQDHQAKKQSMLRELRVAHRVNPPAPQRDDAA